MSNRSGDEKQIRAAAVFAAIDTWYACTNTIEMSSDANCIMLDVTAAVASPGDIEFKVERSSDRGTTWFDYCTANNAPRVWGPLKFSAAGAKAIELRGVNLPPGDFVRISFRATTNAASATVAIDALAYQSESAGIVEELANYIRADNANRDKEINPLDTHVSEVTLLDDTDVAADTYYYPSSDGAEMTPYQALSLWGKLIDGDGTITVTVEATGRASPVAADWEDITKSFLDENLNTDTHASFTVTNGTLVFQISNKRANWRRYRVKMVNNGATNTIILEARRTAL